jgi:hypothetical protein
MKQPINISIPAITLEAVPIEHSRAVSTMPLSNEPSALQHAKVITQSVTLQQSRICKDKEGSATDDKTEATTTNMGVGAIVKITAMATMNAVTSILTPVPAAIVAPSAKLIIEKLTKSAAVKSLNTKPALLFVSKHNNTKIRKTIDSYTCLARLNLA